MAKYSNSPFGTIKGSQMGMVAARWKGINYVRQHVIPANPQSAAQTTQRNKMKNITEWGRRIVDTILNTYTLPLPKKMSPFNYFVSRNVKLQSSGTIDYSEIVPVIGALYNPGVSTFVGDVSDADVEVTYATTEQGEAQSTDVAHIIVYNETQDKFYIGGGDTRADGGTSVVATGLELTDTVHGWLFFVNADGDMVSDADYSVVTVQA